MVMKNATQDLNSIEQRNGMNIQSRAAQLTCTRLHFVGWGEQPDGRVSAPFMQTESCSQSFVHTRLHAGTP